MNKTLLASALMLALSCSANATEYDADSFKDLGPNINVTNDMVVNGAILGNVTSLKTTGSFDWFGSGNDTAEIKADITAKNFIYRGHLGNQKSRQISGKVNADTLTIIAEKDANGNTQHGLQVVNDTVLDNVKAIRIEAKNDGLASLSFGPGVEDTIGATISFAHDGSKNGARIEIEDKASVNFSKVVAESGNSKIQVNHSADVTLSSVDVKDGAYFSLDFWTNKQNQTAKFDLNEINVGENAAFRVAVYDKNKPNVVINGDLNINLNKNAIVDLGGEKNPDWNSDTITINSKQIQVNLNDLSGENHVYLSKEGTDLSKTQVLLKANGNSGSGDVNADLNKMASIVELSSNAASADQPAEKTAAVGTQLSITEGMYAGEASAVVGSNGDATNVAIKTNSIMSNVLDLASSQALSMNRILMNDVRKRLGDIRSTEQTHGVWARYDGGKFTGSHEYKNDFSTLQFGVDTIPEADSPRFGVSFAYTKSDADLKRGSADMDAYSLAFYGTKMYDSGLFVDVIGRMAKADTDVAIDGTKKGTLDNVALSVSGELGWRFDVTDSFYLEPQTEMTYTYVDSNQLTLSSGHEYELDSVNSLIGRVGFAAGLKCTANKGNIYVRASAVHEFMGDASVRGETQVHEIDGKDTWVEYGIGANLNLTKSTYVWADVERTGGATLDEDWRATVGVRYAF